MEINRKVLSEITPDEEDVELPIVLRGKDKLSRKGRKIIRKEIKRARIAVMRRNANIIEVKFSRETAKNMHKALEGVSGELKKVRLYGKTHEVEAVVVRGTTLWYRWPGSKNRTPHRTSIKNLMK